MKGRRPRDPYRLLGVSRDATRDELTQAYVRRTARAGTDFEGPERKALDLAYRLLWRPKTRERYDRLYTAAVRRMRWTVGLGAASVLLLLFMVPQAGAWLFNLGGGQPTPLQALIPFLKPISPPASASRAGSSPAPTTSNRPTRAPTLNPSSITLTLTDLPAGYHLLSQGPVSFSAASASGPPKTGVPPSWDVIFARDSGQSSSRRLVESLAVVYQNSGNARAALAQLEAAEAAQPVTKEPAPPALGSFADQWVERAPNGGPYTVVRLAWVRDVVVSQVSVLDVADPSTFTQAANLALMQQQRLTGSR